MAVYQNSSRAAIQQLQHQLNYYAGARLKEDGVFGPKTLEAVQTWQRRTGGMITSGYYVDDSTLSSLGIDPTRSNAFQGASVSGSAQVAPKSGGTPQGSGSPSLLGYSGNKPVIDYNGALASGLFALYQAGRMGTVNGMWDVITTPSGTALTPAAENNNWQRDLAMLGIGGATGIAIGTGTVVIVLVLLAVIALK